MEIKQSFAWWCFAQTVRDVSSFFHAARQIGYQGIELLPQELWSAARDAGLVVVTESVGDISKGWNRIENHAQLEQETLQKIKLAAEHNILNLIVFSGNREDLDDETGVSNTIMGLKKLAPIAEERGVCLLLELLNSKVDHLDYQCDHTDWAVEVISQVNSPNIRILYDIYHMQIMEGDIIRTIQKYAGFFGHIHTAGNPGRRDLDDDQELNYRPIMKALHQSGYAGFIGQEFIPKGDPITALEHAYKLCTIIS